MTMLARRDAIHAITKKTRNYESKSNKEHQICECFGENSFNENAQKKFLSDTYFHSFQKIVKAGDPLNPEIAHAVASGMKDWALQKGATHYCHWFQPLTDLTAEKHDSFFVPDANGCAIAEFNGKTLTQGEPDASSFPSGGIRTTFEARGYTSWDPSSPVFIFGRTLFIPSIFLSWSGEALDKKTPLLRSMDALNTQALRLLKLFGDKETDTVFPTVGAEQEYFLIDKYFYNLRPDLLCCDRVLFGAKPSKGQELEDQYFGSISDRVLAIMEEAEYELMRLGVPIKTRHNEVAPSQYELALTFEKANLAVDHNMIVMDVLKKVAERHSMACLFHEKPFAHVNGSGKHNNWSMATNSGKNLLEPGDTPHDNAQFLVFCAATIRAVYKHATLLRMSIASAGNDHRLGQHEAPPAIMSVFLGQQLFEIFERLAHHQVGTNKDHKNELMIGVSRLPKLPRHTSDRNRTSPFAFTGNKFEFRAVGASANVARATTVLNTIVAESLDFFATELEKKLREDKNFNECVQHLLHEVSSEFKPILFEGDNYSASWHQEAEKRGLPNITNAVDAAAYFTSSEALSLFTKYHVFNRKELTSRQEIVWEKYVKKLNIEAKTASNIAHTMIIPAVLHYVNEIAEASQILNSDQDLLKDIGKEFNGLKKALRSLDDAMIKHPKGDVHAHAVFMRDKVLPLLNELRTHADRLEEIVCDENWPLPKYREMLFIR